MNFSYWSSMNSAQRASFLGSYTNTVISPAQWTKSTISYSFATQPTGNVTNVPAGQQVNFTPFNTAEQAATRFFFSYVSSFVNLNFVEASANSGDIKLGKHNMDPAGYAYLPYGNQSEVYIANNVSTAAWGDYGIGTLAHEIGHSLGLTHARAYGGSKTNPELPTDLDSTFLSIMSYSDVVSQTVAPSLKYVSALMPLDIAALVQMYGARGSAENNVFLVDDGFFTASKSGATWSISGDTPFTVVDNGGFDTIDMSNYNSSGVVFRFDDGVFLSGQNAYSQINVYGSSSQSLAGQTGSVPMIGIYPTTVIEKFVGTAGDDVVYGNGAGQWVDGAAGSDIFVFSGSKAGYTFVLDSATNELLVTDINPADGNDGADRFTNIEYFNFADQQGVGTGGLIPATWFADRGGVTTVASTWQLLMGQVPTQAGFEYLIKSAANPTDLNDPYFAAFNLENKYLNFACNLAFETPQSVALYKQNYGSLTFAAAVEKAVNEIITASGNADLAGAKAFFMNAQGYYQQVAMERIVRPGVSLEDATKVAMLSSVLYESVRSDAGPYGLAVNMFANDVSAAGASSHFNGSLFAA